jgi:FAD/FMN-containing dehydrogenase
MTTSAYEILQAASLKGSVIGADHPEFTNARRVFNGMIDRRPSVIARCAVVDDVVTAVNAARETGIGVSVRGGGHSVTGSGVADGAVCIDLRDLNQVSVDVDAKTVRVQGGATWGDVDAATQQHGLAVTGGRVSTTGVGGLTLGSGSGWLERSLGFTCDNLLSAQVVTASGDVVMASETENPDLFWAIRGGGGNFGVVTEFTFALHRVGPILLAGMLVYPAAMARELTRFWRDFMLDAPDEVGSAMAFITAPPADFVPPPVQGHPVVGIIVCYNGDPDEGRRVLAPLLEFGPPAVNLVQPMPYVAVQQLIDEGAPEGMHNYWSADFLRELPDEAIDAYLPHATQPVSPLTQLLILAGGGAISRVADDATALGQRRAPFSTHYLSMWPDPADSQRNIEYTRKVSASLKPYATGEVYLNFIGDEGAQRVADAFGPERFAKLREIKKQWDPDNLFRFNQNIPPA